MDIKLIAKLLLVKSQAERSQPWRRAYLALHEQLDLVVEVNASLPTKCRELSTAEYPIW
jgi:hypothetical protein